MIFIVGYSRSGTKMMNKILETIDVSDVVPEIHFFEQFYNFSDGQNDEAYTDYNKLANKLCQIIRRGGRSLKSGITVDSVEKQLNTYVDNKPNGGITSLDVYKKLLDLINTKTPIDPTPRNAYYISNILELMPDAKFIYIVRDPRDCILSQSKKWRSYYYDKERPFEALRLILNYNPSLMARFWKNSYKQLETLESNQLNKNIYLVKYEDITANPHEVLNEIKGFLGSTDGAKDYDLNFIRSNNTQKWKCGYRKYQLYPIESVLNSELTATDYPTNEFSNFDKLLGRLYGGWFWLKLPFSF